MRVHGALSANEDAQLRAVKCALSLSGAGCGGSATFVRAGSAGLDAVHVCKADQWFLLTQNDAIDVLRAPADFWTRFDVVSAPDELYFATVLAFLGTVDSAGEAARTTRRKTRIVGGQAPFKHDEDVAIVDEVSVCCVV